MAGLNWRIILRYCQGGVKGTPLVGHFLKIYFFPRAGSPKNFEHDLSC